MFNQVNNTLIFPIPYNHAYHATDQEAIKNIFCFGDPRILHYHSLYALHVYSLKRGGISVSFCS